MIVIESKCTFKQLLKNLNQKSLNPLFIKIKNYNFAQTFKFLKIILQLNF